MGICIRVAGSQSNKSFLAIIILAISSIPMCASQQALITWNRSPQDGISGYRVYYGPSSGNYTNVVMVGNVTNTLITGLCEGVTYYFAATSYNVLDMESVFSNEAAFNVPRDCTLSIIKLDAGVAVTASGAVPNRWALETSPDFASWQTVTRGTNVAVNVTVPAPGGGQQFFRLKSE